MIELTYEKEIPEAIIEKYLSKNQAAEPYSEAATIGEINVNETAEGMNEALNITLLQSESPNPVHNQHKSLSNPQPDNHL